VAAPVAIGSQALLTFMERGLWRGKHVSAVTVAALLFDVLLNAGGVYPLAMRIGATPTAGMLADAFGWERAISPIGAMILAIIGGFLIAAAPEEFWIRRD
jgi:arginine exporter protein ArgO